jgi:hypothetical protein
MGIHDLQFLVPGKHGYHDGERNGILVYTEAWEDEGKTWRKDFDITYVRVSWHREQSTANEARPPYWRPRFVIPWC